MRKIVMLNMVSVDGYYAGTHGEIDWFIPEPEIYKATSKIGQGQADTLLCGRVTYQELESYWPGVAADPNAPEIARAMANDLNRMTKVVFSRTLTGVTWENSQLVHDNLINEVQKLKQGDGSDILIFGSGTIVQQLTEEGLIDDYLLTVTPVILGAGKPLFKDGNRRNLELAETRNFESGNALLHYKRA